MISLILPDGEIREYETPVSGADIAADIGPGLAKAALAIRINNELKDLSVAIRHTIMGNPKYDENANFLDNSLDSPLKRRLAIGVRFCSRVQSKLGPIKYVMNLNKINSTNLYNDEQFLDCQISLLFNINY